MSKEDIATKLRQARLQANMTQKQVADRIGMTYQAISNYERGKTKVESDILVKLCEIYGVSVPEVLIPKCDGKPDPPPGFEPMPEMTKIPLVGQIACGEPITAEENIEDYVNALNNWHADFALECIGNSMEPKIKDGDIVAIRKQPCVENGEIAAVRIGDEATLKRVYIYADRMILQPINTTYEPIMLFREEMNTATIEGKAVGFCRSL